MQLTRATAPRRAVALVVAAVAATLTACTGGTDTAQRGEPQRADGQSPGRREARSAEAGWVRVAVPEELPGATVAVGGRRFVPEVVAKDWRAKGGIARVPGERVTWRRVPEGRGWALRIGSDVQPARVVLYRYRTVGRDGAPDAAPATESICTTANATCIVSAPRGGARGVVVAPRRLPRYGYFLVQATWFVPRAAPVAAGDRVPRGEVSVTWGFAATSRE